MFRSSSAATGILTAILAMAACVGSDATAPQPPSISIAVSPADVTVLCGAAGVAMATLTRNGGFAGVVNVSVSGLPPGVTAFLSDRELAGTSTSTMITVVAKENAPPGSHTITVKASSSVGAVTATYTLVIVEAPLFRLSVEPSVLTVPPGGSGTAIVRIGRSGGFSGSVALSLTDPPSGLTVTLDPVIVTEAASTITLAVGPLAPTGSHVLTVVGAADGLPTATSRIALDVRSPGQSFLVAEPSELTVVRGGQGRTEVSVVTDYEMDGWATYSLVNPPSGISATFEYHFDWGYPATALIDVLSTVAAGRYMLTLGVAFPGIATRTMMIGLTVTDP
jgi:hypothetical protein